MLTGAARWGLRSLLIATLVVQGWSAWRAMLHDAEMAAGKKLYSQGLWEAALARFEAARAVNDTDSQTWAWAGDAAISWNDAMASDSEAEPGRLRALGSAWVGYAGSVLRCPTDAWSWSGLAAVGVRRMRIEDRSAPIEIARIERRSDGILDAGYAAALAAANVSLYLKPSGYQQLDGLGAIYEATGNVARARELYQQSARAMPAPSFHVWGGGQRLPAPLYQAVKQGLLEGLERAPAFDKGFHHTEIGRFALSQGDVDAAIEHIMNAKRLATDPFHLYYALYDLASALEAAGRLDEALQALKESRDAGFPRAPVSRRIGSLALRLGRPDDACLELRESLREMSDDVGLRIDTSSACEQAGRIDLAEQALRDGFVLPSDNLTLSRALIDLYLRTDRGHMAGYLAEQWAADFPDQPEFKRWADSLPSSTR